jgi:hypothetical protein
MAIADLMAGEWRQATLATRPADRLFAKACLAPDLQSSASSSRHPHRGHLQRLRLRGFEATPLVPVLRRLRHL